MDNQVASCQRRPAGLLLQCAGVIYAEPDPVIITEIELGARAMEMPVAAVLIDAFHPPLED
jgi:hypothetical protein